MESEITRLAARQLEAYNQGDLEAFCACYHTDVVVYDENGQESLKGITAFRERYAVMFANGHFGATVNTRLSVGDHCIDLEEYWRGTAAGEDAIRGEVLVRYRLKEDRIGEVQFLR